MNNDVTQQDPDQLERLKQGMRASWVAGDFGQVAKYTAAEAAEFIDRLPIHAGMDVLDVACGTGNLAIPAARAGARVSGVDIAANLIEQARARAAAENLTIDFRVGDAEELPFPDASFDMVVTFPPDDTLGPAPQLQLPGAGQTWRGVGPACAASGGCSATGFVGQGRGREGTIRGGGLQGPDLSASRDVSLSVSSRTRRAVFPRIFRPHASGVFPARRRGTGRDGCRTGKIVDRSQ